MTIMTNNIVLIGLMGAGKTTIGKALANVLDWNFVDIDEEIVKQEQMSINEIFKQKSEEYFRELETQVIKKFAGQKNAVISLGGGAFEKGVNRKILLGSGAVFYLYADVETLYERIKTDSSRPLLKCENPKGKLQELLKNREPNYKKAHYIIDTNKSLEEILENLQEKL